MALTIEQEKVLAAIADGYIAQGQDVAALLAVQGLRAKRDGRVAERAKLGEARQASIDDYDAQIAQASQDIAALDAAINEALAGKK